MLFKVKVGKECNPYLNYANRTSSLELLSSRIDGVRCFISEVIARSLIQEYMRFRTSRLKRLSNMLQKSKHGAFLCSTTTL